MAMFGKSGREVGKILKGIGNLSLLVFGFFLVFFSTHTQNWRVGGMGDTIHGTDVAHADIPGGGATGCGVGGGGGGGGDCGSGGCAGGGGAGSGGASCGCSGDDGG